MQLSSQVKISPVNVYVVKQTGVVFLRVFILYYGMEMINTLLQKWKIPSRRANILIMGMQTGGVYLDSNVINII